MPSLSAILQVIRSLLEPTKYVIVVEHDLSVLDYLSDFICCLYGKPGAYGVVTMPFSVREGINIFLSGEQHSLKPNSSGTAQPCFARQLPGQCIAAAQHDCNLTASPAEPCRPCPAVYTLHSSVCLHVQDSTLHVQDSTTHQCTQSALQALWPFSELKSPFITHTQPDSLGPFPLQALCPLRICGSGRRA